MTRLPGVGAAARRPSVGGGAGSRKRRLAGSRPRSASGASKSAGVRLRGLGVVKGLRHRSGARGRVERCYAQVLCGLGPKRPPAPMSTTSTASWRVLDVELELGEPDALAAERAARSVGLDPARLRGARIALDARRRGGSRRLRFVCSVDLVADADVRSSALQKAIRAGRVRPAPERASLADAPRDAGWEGPGRAPVAVVGSGPGGLFAALALALNHVAVVLLERGPALAERGRHVVRFHRTRVPDPERNLLFGEGGAGTYSDGKIYTRVDDPLEVALLDELVAC